MKKMLTLVAMAVLLLSLSSINYASDSATNQNSTATASSPVKLNSGTISEIDLVAKNITIKFVKAGEITVKIDDKTQFANPEIKSIADLKIGMLVRVTVDSNNYAKKIQVKAFVTKKSQ